MVHNFPIRKHKSSSDNFNDGSKAVFRTSVSDKEIQVLILRCQAVSYRMRSIWCNLHEHVTLTEVNKFLLLVAQFVFSKCRREYVLTISANYVSGELCPPLWKNNLFSRMFIQQKDLNSYFPYLHNPLIQAINSSLHNLLKPVIFV